LSDYRPIACADHERLELAALKRQWLVVTVTAGEQQGRQRLKPLDVYTQAGAEWLLAETESGARVTLRLDGLAFDA
jgi:Rho-binding antiterminator